MGLPKKGASELQEGCKSVVRRLIERPSGRLGAHPAKACRITQQSAIFFLFTFSKEVIP
jgi:hypothetical protein